MSELRISCDLSLPKEAATWVISYLAKRGAGKTYNAADQAEEMLKAKIPIVVIDGMGIWWGLRVSSDGKGEGLPVVVFGGEHADLPLVPEKAAAMAKAIVESNISCVLDLSGFSKYAMRKIVTVFLNELYRLNRVVRHVFIEESDMFAPQRPIGNEANLCLSAVDNFVRRGGNHNLGVTLISQRSAVLNKDILTQSDCLVILRTLAPQDKKAIQAWVEEQTDEDKTQLKEWYDSLKSLENGEAWVWHPEKPEIFQKVKFRLRETFHATREFIRSQQSTQIVLMNVDEFIEKFKRIFEVAASPTPASVNASVASSVDKAALEAARQEGYNEAKKEFEAERKTLDDRLYEMTLKEAERCDQLEDAHKKLKKADAFREALTEFLFPDGLPTSIPTPSPTAMPTAGQTVGLQATTTIIDVPIAEKFVTMNTESVAGKILFVAKKGKLDTLQRLGDIVKAIQDERWNVTTQQVNNALTELVKDNLIAKKHTDRNYFCLAQGVRFKEAS